MRKDGESLTALLRAALRDAPTLAEVARATGVQRASLVRFRDGEQSIMLDAADKLAAHFGIESKARKAKRGRKG